MTFAGFGNVPEEVRRTQRSSGSRLSSADGPSSKLRSRAKLLNRFFRHKRRDVQDDSLEVNLVDSDTEPADQTITEIELMSEIKKIDMNITENATTHHSDEFATVLSNSKAVLRRGQSFKVTVKFESPIPKFIATDLTIVMTLVRSQTTPTSTEKRITIKCELPGGKKENVWWGEVTEVHGQTVHVKINIDANAPIGRWQMQLLAVNSCGQTTDALYENIFILFNPWCKDDQVFMEEPELVDEYILNDTGKIWRGTVDNPTSISWTFGQFEDHILESCMLILESTRLNIQQRSSAILINSNDDDGVLHGQWGDPYPDGEAPTFWSGSAPILLEYEHNNRPVKYGQCWVFSGVVTTVCRCLGIPARSVTNYVSGHETDGSLTIDQYFNEDGKYLNSSDSIWNYHVWNEVWMKRNDLPSGYDGWQAIDATPQEKSKGKYQCGPAPLSAIKEGHVGLNYDIPFIFSEVNADTIYWRKKDNGDPEVIKILTSQCGQMISTKKPRKLIAKSSNAPNNDREDITGLYKHPEKTADNRETFKRALINRGCQLQEPYSSQFAKISKSEDITVNFLFPQKPVEFGKIVRIGVNFKNSSHSRLIVDYRVLINNTSYTGHDMTQLQCTKGHVTVSGAKSSHPGEFCSYVQITPTDYGCLQEQCILHITLSGTVKTTNQNILITTNYSLAKPKLELTPEGKFKVEQSQRVLLKVKNPIKKVLRNGRLILEGPGVKMSSDYDIPDIEATKTLCLHVKVIPWKKGQRTLTAKYTCDQIYDMEGSIEIMVDE